MKKSDTDFFLKSLDLNYLESGNCISQLRVQKHLHDLYLRLKKSNFYIERYPSVKNVFDSSYSSLYGFQVWRESE